MDIEVANELANLYETMRWVCEIQVKLAAGVQALALTVVGSSDLSGAYAKHLEAEEQNELHQQLTLLLNAIGVRMEALRKGQIPPGTGSVH